MTDKPALDDQAIRALLERRAGRPDVAGRLATVRSAAAATPQRRVGRFGLGTNPRPTLVGAAGLAAGVLVLVTVGLTSKAPSTGTPTGSPLVGSSSPGPNLSPIPSSTSGPIVLTVDELNGLMATDPGGVTGHELVISGEIVTQGDACTLVPQGTCNFGLHLLGSSPELGVEAPNRLRSWPSEHGSTAALVGDIRRGPGSSHAQLSGRGVDDRARICVSPEQAT